MEIEKAAENPNENAQQATENTSVPQNEGWK